MYQLAWLTKLCLIVFLVGTTTYQMEKKVIMQGKLFVLLKVLDLRLTQHSSLLIQNPLAALFFFWFSDASQ